MYSCWLSYTHYMNNTPVSPEDYYSNVRKIDWDGINKYHKDIGNRGETLVFELEKHFLQITGNESLADKIAYKDDGVGYDILSYFPDGREKYIEVKTTQTIDKPYYISRKELEFMGKNKENSFIYRVIITAEDIPTRLRVYTFREVLNAKPLPQKFAVNHIEAS